jgi:VWFA-related protein
MLVSRFGFLSALLLFGRICEASPQQSVRVTAQTEADGNKVSTQPVWISVHSKNSSSPQPSISDLDVKLDGKSAFVSSADRLRPALRYCLLLDSSASTRSTRSIQHGEAVALLKGIPQAGRDYGLLVTFNSQSYLDAEGTDPQKLIKSINQDARGATAMYDAMVACSDYLTKDGTPKDSSNTPLRLMLVLSDGVDNASRTTREDAERTLIEGRIRVYSIGQESSVPYRRDQAAKASKYLKQIAESTGGKDYRSNTGMSVDQILQEISDDLANLYALTLSSERTVPGHVYKLEVRCRKSDCAVTAPREYFVPR